MVPGGFVLKQRYGYDRRKGRVWLISREQAEALLQHGRGIELRGTLVPDVVIHAGDPLKVLAIYDLRFPCPGTNPARWRDYPKSHAYHPSNQGDMYKEALGIASFRGSPVWGVQ